MRDPGALPRLCCPDATAENGTLWLFQRTNLTRILSEMASSSSAVQPVRVQNEIRSGDKSRDYRDYRDLSVPGSEKCRFSKWHSCAWDVGKSRWSPYSRRVDGTASTRAGGYRMGSTNQLFEFLELGRLFKR